MRVPGGVQQEATEHVRDNLADVKRIRGFLTGMAQAVQAPDCPWSDMPRLVLEVAPCR